MRMLVFCSLLIAAPAMAGDDPTRIGDVSTTFRMVGRNEKIVVDRYDDPKVPGVSCYVSRAETDGIRGSVGHACRSSQSCRTILVTDSHDQGDSRMNSEPRKSLIRRDLQSHQLGKVTSSAAQAAAA